MREPETNFTTSVPTTDMGNSGALVTETWQVPTYTITRFAPRRHRYCFVAIVVNEGERIRRQLERMAESRALVDLILVDGGSTDGSLAQ